VAGEPTRYRSAFMRAAAADNTLPMDRAATDLWLLDVQNPLRWLVRPVLQFLFAALLHITWLLKRLPLRLGRWLTMLYRYLDLAVALLVVCAALSAAAIGVALNSRWLGSDMLQPWGALSAWLPAWDWINS